MNGTSDYGSGLSSPHPFDLKYPKHTERLIAHLKTKNDLWRYLTIAGLCTILLNIMLMFWLTHIHKPKVFVSTILESGSIYQQGFFDLPLSQKGSKFILSTQKVQQNKIQLKSQKNNDYE